MATVEKVESQTLRETTEGVTLNRIFTSTFDDYNNGVAIPRFIPYGTDNPFPFRVGDALAYDNLGFPVVTNRTLNMRITEINVRPVDNINIIAEIFYSTVFDRTSERGEPNTNASWEEQFDMSSVVTSDDIYYSDLTGGLPYKNRAAEGVRESWIADWADAGNEEEDRPPHELYNPTWIWTVRAYSNELYFQRITNAFQSVNNIRWLDTYFTAIANRNGTFAGAAQPTTHATDSTDSSPILDGGRWLFTACPIRRYTFNSWEYNFEFTYNTRWPWNSPYNITQDKYPELDFTTLFAGMTNAPSAESQGVARS